MPYSSVSEIPDYVTGSAKRKRQWMHVFNSELRSRLAAGDEQKEAERRAFAAANAAVKDVKVMATVLAKAVGTKRTGFVRAINGPFSCEHCEHIQKFSRSIGECAQPDINDDPELVNERHSVDDLLLVAAGDCCNEFDPVRKEKGMKPGTFSKFIPFIKVDATKREVWGVVTAELPDKDGEVCDYEGSKPYYQAVIAEMGKATGGENFFPLREMHGLSAAGKCVGFDFRDTDKEIFMGFKVVDDDAWNKVDECVYSGFSQGGQIVGKMEPDPVFKGCRRYVANPSEISLVDNPALAAAHFTYVSKTGDVELRKFKTVIQPAVGEDLRERVTSLEKLVLKKVRTKRVDGEDLPASSFLIVLDPERTATWNLPVKFSTEAKTKTHLRDALARFNQLKNVPQDVKDKAWKKLVSLAEAHDIDVNAEQKVFRAVFERVRRLARVHVNRLAKTAPGNNVGVTLAMLDPDLGRLQKGLFDVSCLAEVVNQVAFIAYSVVCEQEFEGDEDSPLPALLEEDVSNLLDTLLHMVEEESEELREDLAARVHQG